MITQQRATLGYVDSMHQVRDTAGYDSVMMQWMQVGSPGTKPPMEWVCGPCASLAPPATASRNLQISLSRQVLAMHKCLWVQWKVDSSSFSSHFRQASSPSCCCPCPTLDPMSQSILPESSWCSSFHQTRRDMGDVLFKKNSWYLGRSFHLGLAGVGPVLQTGDFSMKGWTSGISPGISPGEEQRHHCIHMDCQYAFATANGHGALYRERGGPL